MRSSLINLIYKKSLRLSTNAKRSSTVGEIVNLMQVNTNAFYDLMKNIQLLSSIPSQLLFAILLLWVYMGTAFLAAVGSVLCILPVLFMVSWYYEKFEGQKIELKDSRLKIINEILNGIKVLKYYGWEVSFLHIVEKIRAVELKVLKKFSFVWGVGSFSFNFTSFFIQLVTFVVFLYMDGGKNILTPSIAFVSLSLFNMIRMPLFSSSIVAPFVVQVRFF